MKSIYKKKIEKAAVLIREVFDDLEAEESADFDAYGTRLDDLAGELDDILADAEEKSAEEEDEDKGYEVE
ncbi:MAG: hypothetical protein Q7U56_05500 [Humidesulfovibrio sp.]|nr:hypothetical protein [Desulfovibrio sp.]MDO9082718.1 hypothetical protein [Humidesulfovibrio sp.]